MAKTTPNSEAHRYARQTVLEDWGAKGQTRIAASSALIIGLGGLGAPILTYLAGAGVGTITLNDFDTIDITNLPRQPTFTQADVGNAKASVAAEFLRARNPTITTRAIDQRLNATELESEVRNHDLVLDATDHFGSRFAINTASVATQTPHIAAAAIRYAGHVVAFDRRTPNVPCYACIYGEDDMVDGTCAGQGVFPPLVGLVGSMAAAAALRLMLNDPVDERTLLHCVDAQTLAVRAVAVERQSGCPVCSSL
ncbi:MAG: HesA/MoeB/ThiF family protein [Pseudomonadota bacterium]